jgi:hypothetical protein
MDRILATAAFGIMIGVMLTWALLRPRPAQMTVVEAAFFDHCMATSGDYEDCAGTIASMHRARTGAARPSK